MQEAAFRGPDLVLVPTALELRRLEALGAFPDPARCELCGFGPVAAAARAAQLIGALRPRRALLVGIAGSLDLARAPLASARAFGRVHLEGVGAGAGADFQPPSRLGFPQWEDRHGRVAEVLELAGGGPDELLTACAAAASPRDAAERRARYPQATAEDLEGFGAALACRLAGVPLVVVRGISNACGERDRAAWRVDDALAAARRLALEWLARDAWPGTRRDA